MTATIPTGPGDVHPDTREVLELLIARGYSADTLIEVASMLRHDRRLREATVAETSPDPTDDDSRVIDSREIYDDSDDGGYESGSYFTHAMGKD